MVTDSEGNQRNLKKLGAVLFLATEMFLLSVLYYFALKEFLR